MRKVLFDDAAEAGVLFESAFCVFWEIGMRGFDPNMEFELEGVDG